MRLIISWWQAFVGASCKGSELELFDGVMYFPNQAVQFSGNSELEDSEAVIIADTVSFTGNTEVELETEPDPANPLLAEASLVE